MPAFYKYNIYNFKQIIKLNIHSALKVLIVCFYIVLAVSYRKTKPAQL